MANTFELIASSTVGVTPVTSIDFTSISGSYTDLVLKLSLRNATLNVTGGGQVFYVRFNSNTSSYSGRYLFGQGSGTPTSASDLYVLGDPSDATASTFGSADVYIPNYAGSANKSYSADSVSENNATRADAILTAALWSNTAAITSINITPAVGGTIAQYSTAYLYGVKNA